VSGSGRRVTTHWDPSSGLRDSLAFVATCDLAGHVRGKGFPTADVERRMRVGMGFTHSNIMMSAFGPIYATPFGTEGDLMLVPDPATRVDIPFEGGASERFYLGDLKTTEAASWECCPRHFARRAFAALHAASGFGLRAAFEQEFVYTGVDDRPSATYALDAFRRQGLFGEAFLGALRYAGLTPDSFMPEYGARQYEVTVAPARDLRVADEAVILRELARSVAWRLGHRAIFAPMLSPDGIGNGTHIHFSLVDETGGPAMHDPQGRHGLSAVGAQFTAGVLHHMPALSALTAPSVASYYRLTPNRWAPTWTTLGVRDRGAALRVCPVFSATDRRAAAAQFNVEYRVADATASPYLALGAIVWAGVDGIRRKLALPDIPVTGFWDMSESEREAAGARRLPSTLPEALDELEADAQAAEWLGPRLRECYLQLKRSEIAALDGLTDAEICERYAECY
jgi:glutamine synthetase